ncbi:MAG: hypothetical protein ACI9OO_002048, partial [Bacteroidia bacterium]
MDLRCLGPLLRDPFFEDFIQISAVFLGHSGVAGQ